MPNLDEAIQRDDPQPTGRPGAPSGRSLGLRPDTWILLAAVAGPVAVAAVLTRWRGSLDTADNALFLVVVIVAVASTGRRLAAMVAALVSALSFDYFLTRPYDSFRITSHQDLITETLLLVVGLAVGELAARGRRHRDLAASVRDEVDLIHAVTELAASGAEPDLVIGAAADGLSDLLDLRDCAFSRVDPHLAARVSPDGDLTVGAEHWSTADLGLPTRGADLPVRGGGWLLGHFALTPTPGRPVTRHRLQVAVAVADQVGAALAADELHPAPRT